jgi:hypothetical protein
MKTRPSEVTTEIPPHGALSGMIITGATAVLVITLCLLIPSFKAHFQAPLSERLLNFFLLSILIMALHKAESFYALEYEKCPVYLNSGRTDWAKNPRKAIFLSFVSTFIGMLFVVYLALLGPPWHLVLITIWLAQGLHECHHLAKSLARKIFYPGLFTSLLFVLVQSFAVFPLWYDQVIGNRGVIYFAYYALVPCTVLAFYFEDSAWTALATA